MKINIFTILFLVGIFHSSYAFDENIFHDKKLEHKEIRKITEETHNKWESVSFFDEDGYLLHKINSYKKEVRSDYKYDYVITDILLEIRETNTIGIDVNEQKKTDKYFYDSLGQCYKYREYYSDFDNPSFFGDNFVYENGMLISYTKANFWQKNNNKPTKVTFEYNEKKQKIRKIEVANETDTTFFTYKYNQSGQLTDYIQESNSNDVVYSGVVAWSNEKLNKIPKIRSRFFCYFKANTVLI